MNIISRRIQVLLAIFLGSGFVSIGHVCSQDWIQQAPYPADVDLLGVHFSSPTHGWISGRDDLLMRTTDGGLTWTQTPSVNRSPQFSEDPIWDVQFVDELHGWAWGNNGYRTTDGGQTWQQLPFVDSISDVQFLDSQTGYLISNLAVYRTSNGGSSVSIVWDWQDFNFVSDATFISADRGLLAAEEDDVPGIFETVDAGQSWQRISDQDLGQILFVSSEIVVGSRAGKFYQSINGGRDWTLVHDDSVMGPFNNAMEEMALTDEDSVAAIDINARIWISNDAGNTWTLTQNVLGNWGFGWDIQFPTPEIGYAAGRLGLILKTQDGGLTWEQSSNGAAADLNDIVMLSEGTGIAVGDTGVILRTENFGQTWNLLPQIQLNGIAQELNSVKAINPDTFVAGGSAFFRSDDAGETWNQGGQLPSIINDLTFRNTNEGWACGPNATLGFYIAGTVDGGQNWTTLQSITDTGHAVKIQVRPSGQGWSIFPQNHQGITTDGFQQNFLLRTLPSGDSWQTFEFGSDQVGWYGGFFGGLLRTDNGGLVFEEETLPGWVFSGGGNGYRLLEIRALSETEVYITTLRPGAIYEGVIYERVDDTWQELSPISVPTNQFAGAIHSSDILPTGEIWTIGGGGFIFTSDVPDSSVLIGDINRDGIVDLLDVIPFVELITSGTFQTEGDINGDGVVDLLDVPQFVELIN